MRKITQKWAFMLMTLLCCIAMPQVVTAQTCEEFGDGTTAGSGSIPVASWYHNSYTQQLYLADELDLGAGNITSIAFQYSNASSMTRQISIYMASTDAENLSNDYVREGLEEVLSPTVVTFDNSEEWFTIELENPFEYDGNSNLVVAVYMTYSTSETLYSSGSRFLTISSTGMARYQTSDTQSATAIALTDGVPSTSGSAVSYRTNIQVCYVGGGGPTCDKPSLQTSDTTAHGITLSWGEGSGTYNVEYKKQADTVWTSLLENTNLLTATLANLVPSTDYQARVQSVCGELLSSWKTVSFKTLIGLPYAEEFKGSLPSEWKQYTGLLTDVLAGTANLTSTTYGWSYSSSSFGEFSTHMYTNIYGTSRKNWIVTPEIPIDGNAELSFLMALSKSSSSLTPITKGNQADDKFVVLASVNNGSTWTVLRQWDNAGSADVYDNIATNGEEVIIDLTALNGENVKFAFYGESTVSGGDNYLHIDNVLIDYIPSCLKPSDLALVSATKTSAQLSWTANTAETAWMVQYKKSSANEWTTVAANANPFTLTGLEAFTEYDVQVAAVCDPIAGDTSKYCKSISFKTVAGIPYEEGFNTTLPTEWTRFYADMDGVLNGDSTLEETTYGWGVGAASGVFTATDNHLAVNIWGTACKYWVVSPAVQLDPNVQLTFDIALTKYEGTLEPVTPGEQADDKFAVLISTDHGLTWTQIYLRDNVSTEDAFDAIACSAAGQTIVLDLSDYANETVLLAFYGESTVGSEGTGDNILHIDNVLIDEIPACPKPLVLEVTDIASNSANFAWDEDLGAAWEYAILVNGALDSVPAAFTSTSVHTLTIDTLSPETNYTFYLRRACGDDHSEILARNFTTFRTPEALPWDVNFEDMAAETIPTYWDNSASTTTTVAGTNPHYVWGVYAYDGNKMIRMYNYMVQKGTALINTPLIALPTGEPSELTFDYAHTATCGDLTVKISIDGGATWTALAPTYGKTSTGTDKDNPGDFTPVTINLETYAGNNIMLQFFANANYGSGAIFVDNVSVHEIPDCIKPINILAPADSATVNSIQVAWQAVGPEQNWIIQYKKKADEEWSYVADSVKASPYVITGLDASTLYNVRVAAWCDPADSASISEYSAIATVATECGAVSSFPFKENFDAVAGANTSTNTMPLCWYYYCAGTNTTYNKYPMVYNSATYANSGTNSLKFYTYNSTTATAGTYADQYAILPEMNNVSGLRIKFNARKYSTSYDATFYVGVMNHPDSIATFVAIDTISPAGATYAPYTVMLDSYTGAGKYIAILMPLPATSTYKGVHIDDIVVDEIPDCLEPEGLALVDVKATSAKFKWANEANGAWKYAVVLATAAEPADDAFIDVAADSVIVESLQPQTEYAFYLRKNCGTSVSASISLEFRTSQLPTAIPYADDFEGENTWMLINGTITNAWVVDTAAHNGAGTHALYISNNGGAAHAYSHSAAMVYASKAFAFDGGMYNFKFDWTGNGESTYDYMRVALVPASYALEAGTTIPSGFSATALPAGCIALDGGSKLNLSTAWQTFSSPDIQIPAGEYNVVFAWRNDGTGGSQPPAAVDNFSVSKITCLSVDNVAIPDSTITDATAKVFWTLADSTQTAWQIAIDTIQKNVPDSATLINATSNPYELTGLVANKKYYIAVRANCGEGDLGKWTAVKSFKTAKSCQKPTGLAASEITISSAKISWNTFGVDTFNVRYYNADSTLFVDTMGVTMPFVINGLESSTSYKVRVQPACDNTTWSAVYTFKTAYGVPFDQNFATTPSDWTKYTGLLRSVLNDTAYTTGGSWTVTTGNGVFDTHLRLNIYGTTCKSWYVSPVVTIPANTQLTFDMALTKYSGTLEPVVDTLQQDDKFVVLISTNEGQSWTILRQWDNDSSQYVYNNIACAAEGEPVAISLSEYAGQNIQIAFYGESTVSGGDNNLHIDNVSIDVVPTCLKLKNVKVSDVWAHQAVVNWTLTDSTQTAWQIALDTIAKFKPDTVSALIAVDSLPFTLTGLNEKTTYYLYARANCGEGDYSRWTDLVSFKTVADCETPKDLKLDSISYTSATFSWNGYGLPLFNLRYTADSVWTTVDSIATPYKLSGLENGASYKVQVQPVCAPDSIWTAALSFTTLQIPVAVPFADDFENGNSWLLFNGDLTNAWVVDTAAHNGIGSHALYISNDGGRTNAYTVNSASLAFATKAITIEDSAKYVFKYDWRAKGEGFTSSMWDFMRVALVPADAEIAAATSLPTGLTYSKLPEGWIALDGGQALNNADTWQSKKVSAVVAAGEYKVVVLWRNDGSSGTNPPAAFDNFSVALKTCDQPTALTASDITPRSATLSWTNGAEDQEAWQLVLSNDANLEPDSIGAIDVLSNPYALADLNAETTYYAYVRANCDDGDYSDWSAVCTFTTLPMCTVYGTPVDTTICAGDAYTWRGAIYNETGVYYDTLISLAGCDSIESLVLTVEPAQDTLAIVIDKDTICQGDIFEWNGAEYTQAGLYTVTLISIHGCDSIAKLELAVYDAEDSIFVADTISENDLPYTYEAPYITDQLPIHFDLGTEPGVYTETAYVHGEHCATVLSLTLTITKAQGIENIFDLDGKKVQKLLYHDIMYIIVEDEWYNAAGQKVNDPRK